MINLLENRPGKLNFSHSEVLQNFTRATNVRLRLLRTKTLHGHLMDVSRRDPTVTRRVSLFVATKEAHEVNRNDSFNWTVLMIVDEFCSISMRLKKSSWEVGAFVMDMRTLVISLMSDVPIYSFAGQSLFK